MSERIQIQITATDGATRVFTAVASGAERMDQALDRAGQSSSQLSASSAQMASAVQQVGTATGQAAAGAERLDTELTQTATAAGTAATAQTQLSTQTDTAAGSLNRFSAAGAAVGAALGLAVVAFGEFGAAAAASQAAEAQFAASVEATGATVEEFANQVAAAQAQALSLSFDDEDALAAMSAIITATDDVQTALNDLGLVMDIARGRNIDLASAARIVIAAEQERFTTLRRLGIVLDESATKQEALAALQTKYAGQAEAYADTSAGAFDRFKEKLENTEEAIGAHAEAATSLALVAQTIGPAFSLASTAIGGFGSALTTALTGGAGATTLLTGITAALTGPLGLIVGAAAAVGGLVLLTDFLRDDYQSATKTSAAATDEFTQSIIAMGQQAELSLLEQQIAQVGLRIGEYSNDLNEAADAQHGFSERLQETIGNMGLNDQVGLTADALSALTDAEKEQINTNHDNAISLQELQSALQGVTEPMALTGETAQEYATAWQSAQADIIAILQDTGPAAADAQASLLYYLQNVESGNQTMHGAAMSIADVRDEMDAQNAAAASLGETTGALTNVNDQYVSSLEARKTAASDVAAAMQQDAINMGDAVDGNTEATDRYVAALELIIQLDAMAAELVSGKNSFAGMLEQNVAGIDAAADALDAFGESLGSVLELTGHTYPHTLKDATDAVTQHNVALAAQAKAIDAAKAAMTAELAIMDRLAGREAATAKSEAAMLDAVTEKWRDRVDAIQQAADAQRAADYAASRSRPEAGGYAALVAEAEAAAQAIQDRFLEAYDAIATPPEALEAGFRVIVGNTNAIAQNAQSVADWADELIKAEGVWSTLDDILDTNNTLTTAATINQQEYTAAQEAYNDIVRENAEIQQDVQVIQAKQAPVLAELMAVTENYLQDVAEMSGIQQTAALGFMDSAESAQALQLQMLALDAAQGALGSNGTEWAEGIIQGAAMADPVLRAMLEQMGLISIGADGTITVNFDDQATSPLQALTAAVNDLDQTLLTILTYLDDDPANDGLTELDRKLADLNQFEATPIVNLEDNATGPIDGIQSELITTDSFVATPTVTVIDNATGTLRAVLDLLDAADGRNAYSTITTAYITTGNPTGNANQPMAFGGVANYAVGGVVAEMAEWGPELLHFPNGGVALARQRGLYTVPAGTYVDTAPATASKLGGSLNVTVNVNGPSSWDDAAEQVSRKIITAIQRAMRQYEQSLGVA